MTKVVMATQLQFTRHAYDERPSSFNGSDASSLAWETSHRHVAFAVHDAVPSPQLYQQQKPRFNQQSVDGEDRNAFNSKKAAVWELPVYATDKNEIPRLAKAAPVRTMRTAPVGRSRAAAASRKSTAKQSWTAHYRHLYSHGTVYSSVLLGFVSSLKTCANEARVETRMGKRCHDEIQSI
jgi:hypothetical protein